MDITKFKEKLGDEMFVELQTAWNDLVGQRDTARKESIEGRKSLKSSHEKALASLAKAMEKLGIESEDDLDSLPDAKGQAEAIKQHEAKMKRIERERDDAVKKATEAEQARRAMLQKAAIAEALGGDAWVDREVVESFLTQRVKFEGDDLLYTSSDGKLIPVKDGVAELKQSRPQLLKASGTGGAGVRQSNAGSGGGKTMTRAQFDAASPAERMAHAKAGGSVVDA